jgi:hypothetical protein
VFILLLTKAEDFMQVDVPEEMLNVVEYFNQQPLRRGSVQEVALAAYVLANPPYYNKELTEVFGNPDNPSDVVLLYEGVAYNLSCYKRKWSIRRCGEPKIHFHYSQLGDIDPETESSYIETFKEQLQKRLGKGVEIVEKDTLTKTEFEEYYENQIEEIYRDISASLPY